MPGLQDQIGDNLGLLLRLPDDLDGLVDIQQNPLKALEQVQLLLLPGHDGKAKEIADMRDETDLSGLKLAIDLKRGVDPDKLMAKLYRQTPLERASGCIPC